jgi:hypothetical protein
MPFSTALPDAQDLEREIPLDDRNGPRTLPGFL